MLAENAIKALEGKCWVLLKAIDGTPGEQDSEEHFTSREKALEEYARRYRRHQGEERQEIPLLVPAELDEPCLTITSACGRILDEDNDVTCHQHDPDVLVGWALGMGWAILPDSRMVCTEDPRDCAACAAITAALPPAAPPPIPGQLTIDGSAATTTPAARLTADALPPIGALSSEAEFNLAALRRLKP